MTIQQVTRMGDVRESVCVGWERPRCSAPPASAPPRWSLPPHAHHIPTLDRIRYRTQPSAVPSRVQSESLIRSEPVFVQGLNQYQS
jgi:hypothetical protein